MYFNGLSKNMERFTSLNTFKDIVELSQKLHDKLKELQLEKQIDTSCEANIDLWKYQLTDIINFANARSSWINEAINENEFEIVQLNSRFKAVKFEEAHDYDSPCASCVFVRRNHIGQLSCARKGGYYKIPHCKAEFRKDKTNVYFKAIK